MFRPFEFSIIRIAGAGVAVLALVAVNIGAAEGQVRSRENSARQALAGLEDDLFAEINLLRADPAGYAQRVLVPMKERMIRRPKESEKPFLSFRAYLVGGTEIDYLTLDEGGTEETARAMLDETIDALTAVPKLSPWERNPVLDQSARFYSVDFLDGGKQRDPHVDSLGRKAGPRIGSFGASRPALDAWRQFVKQLPADRTTTARIFEKDDRYYWLALSGRRAYRYWSVPDTLGEFVEKHGEETTLSRLDQPGYECVLTVNTKTRTLHHGDDQVPYPFLLPVYGENVTWGSWSRKMAARGMVCWWLVDPHIESRGHRKMLLDTDFNFAGVGCARSRGVGWVATLDACAEELLPFPRETVPQE